MSTLPFSKIRSLLLIFSFVLLVGGAGYWLGERKASIGISTDKRIVVNTEAPAAVGDVEFALFWDVWSKVIHYYVEPKTIDMQKLVYGAITGMVNAVGDPYTSFFPPKENKDFKEELGGAFEGIGAQLGLNDGYVIIESPLRGSPAEKAGLKPKDFILKVDGNETVGWSVQDAVNKIRGPKGTKVTLTILHESATKPVDIAIERATITIPSVVSWIKSPSQITEISSATEAASFRNDPKSIAYIQLSRFGDNTNNDWIKAVNEIVAYKKNNANKLAGFILDMRNNPGGYLEGSVFVASEFIKSGVVVSQQNSDGSLQEYKVNRAGSLLDIPMIVMINKGSASAAEIVTGALRDYKRATVVGEKSFGKGTVQTPFDLSGGSSVHITTGKWLLPQGDSISQKGITPDITVALTDSSTATNDAQLAKAIELLLK